MLASGATADAYVYNNNFINYKLFTIVELFNLG